jgi:hypothetical protein
MDRRIWLRLGCPVSSVVKNPELPCRGTSRFSVEMRLARTSAKPRRRNPFYPLGYCKSLYLLGFSDTMSGVRNFHAMETQWIDGHAVFFQPSLRDGVVLCCRFPWTEVHGYPRPSLRDFDPRKLNPTSRPSLRADRRKLLRASAPLREARPFGSAFAFPLRLSRLLR